MEVEVGADWSVSLTGSLPLPLPPANSPHLGNIRHGSHTHTLTPVVAPGPAHTSPRPHRDTDDLRDSHTLSAPAPGPAALPAAALRLCEALLRRTARDDDDDDGGDGEHQTDAASTSASASASSPAFAHARDSLQLRHIAAIISDTHAHTPSSPTTSTISDDAAFAAVASALAALYRGLAFLVAIDSQHRAARRAWRRQLQAAQQEAAAARAAAEAQAEDARAALSGGATAWSAEERGRAALASEREAWGREKAALQADVRSLKEQYVHRARISPSRFI
jgi:hypothetical protein